MEILLALQGRWKVIPSQRLTQRNLSRTTDTDTTAGATGADIVMNKN
jgi:hypothetical protein